MKGRETVIIIIKKSIQIPQKGLGLPSPPVLSRSPLNKKTRSCFKITANGQTTGKKGSGKQAKKNFPVR